MATECRFCEGEGRRFNNAAQWWGECTSCKGRGFKGEPETDAQHLTVARERINELEGRVKELERTIQKQSENTNQLAICNTWLRNGMREIQDALRTDRMTGPHKKAAILAISTRLLKIT